MTLSPSPSKKIGIALGGGGAKGLAHIPMLEVLEELGVRPHRIAGTSIGAIVGALYASGLTATEIRQGVDELTASPQTLKELINLKQLPAWFDFIDVDIGRGDLFDDNFVIAIIDLEFVFTHLVVSSAPGCCPGCSWLQSGRLAAMMNPTAHGASR